MDNLAKLCCHNIHSCHNSLQPPYYGHLHTRQEPNSLWSGKCRLIRRILSYLTWCKIIAHGTIYFNNGIYFICLASRVLGCIPSSIWMIRWTLFFWSSGKGSEHNIKNWYVFIAVSVYQVPEMIINHPFGHTFICTSIVSNEQSIRRFPLVQSTVLWD